MSYLPILSQNRLQYFGENLCYPRVELHVDMSNEYKHEFIFQLQLQVGLHELQ